MFKQKLFARAWLLVALLPLALLPAASAAAQSSGCDIHGTIDSPAFEADVPANAGTEVRGWVVDAATTAGTGISEVQFSLDTPPDRATDVETLYSGYSRPEIGALIGAPRFSRSGFRFVWDVGAETPGRHVLYVRARHACGSITMQRTVTVTTGGASGGPPAALIATSAYQLGLDRAARRDYPGAIEAFTQALQQNPSNAYAYVERARAHAVLGERQDAIADLDRAIELDPNNAVAYRDRGTSKSSLRDYEGEIADLDEAIRLSPDNDRSYYNRGVARANLRDYEGALDDYAGSVRTYADIQREGKLAKKPDPP